MLKIEEIKNTIICGNSLELLQKFPDNCVDMICASPPYYGLRRYNSEPQIWDGDDSCNHSWGTAQLHGSRGNKGEGMNPKNKSAGITQPTKAGGNFCNDCGAWKGELGSEPSPDLFIWHLLQIFNEIKRVLKKEGSCWVNLGDSYNTVSGWAVQMKNGKTPEETQYSCKTGLKEKEGMGGRTDFITNWPKKSLLMVPERFAISMVKNGWCLRNEIIWCLSGGVYVYAKTQKGVMPVMIRDLIRLKPNTIQLWNGQKWTKVLGISKTKRKDSEIEIVLRSGERISCSQTHKFPTNRGLIEAKELLIKDVLQRTQLPDTQFENYSIIDNDAAWLAGLYLAEGSHSADCIQISGHKKEIERWERLKRIAVKFGGTITRTVSGNKMDIRLYGKILNALIAELVSGKTAKDKCFSPKVWKYGNLFIQSMLEAYLHGDGHWDEKNKRWRLGFTRNYNLERDLRTACARLGYHLILNLSTVKYKGKKRPAFRGEIRTFRSGRWNEKTPNEIVEIRKARCRELYDIGVEDEPNLFALNSGVLAHNSKPNCMPESCKDRFTRDFEKIFFFVKSEKYFFNQQFEPIKQDSLRRAEGGWNGRVMDNGKCAGGITPTEKMGERFANPVGRNSRTTWDVNTSGISEDHFASFPQALVKKMIDAGCPEFVCEKCGKAREKILTPTGEMITFGGAGSRTADHLQTSKTSSLRTKQVQARIETGYTDCGCGVNFVGGVVLDPFVGSGTTALTAKKLGRNFVGIEINPKYCEISRRRINKNLGMFQKIGF